MAENFDVNANTLLLKMLPLEVIFTICSYLGEEDIAALSLTSSGLKNTLGREALYNYFNSNATKYSKRGRVQLLERAFPSRFFCSWCDCFHVWDLLEGPANWQSQHGGNCRNLSCVLHIGDEYVLMDHHIRLAMNRHLYGPDYGLPLSALNFQMSDTQLAQQSMVRGMRVTDFSVECRIVKNRLILSASIDIFGPYHDTTSAGQDMERILSGFPIILAHSAHRLPRHLPIDTITCVISQAAMDATLTPAVGETSKNASMDYACEACATDFLITAEMETEVVNKGSAQATTFINRPISASSSNSKPKTPRLKQSLTLKLQVWRDLGTCRSPFDIQWRAHGKPLNGRANSYEATRRNMFNQGKGTVRILFESIDDDSGKAQV
jgi:hypothetical protein